MRAKANPTPTRDCQPWPNLNFLKPDAGNGFGGSLTLPVLRFSELLQLRNCGAFYKVLILKRLIASNLIPFLLASAKPLSIAIRMVK